MISMVPHDRRQQPAATTGLALLRLGAVVPSLICAAIIGATTLWVLPTGSELNNPKILLHNAIAAAAYTAIIAITHTAWGYRWLSIPASADERARRQALLSLPRRIATIHSTVWVGAAALFALVNARSPWLAATLCVSTLTGATVTTAVAYWLSARALRFSIAEVLTAQPPQRARRPGLRLRAISSWVVGSGMPTLMVMMAAGSSLVVDYPGHRLAIVVLILSGSVVVSGLTASVITAAAIADPVDTVGRAMARITRGDFDVIVPVFDTSELGMLQAAFNTMTGGLREREQLRDLFGRHVGRDVALLAEQSLSDHGFEAILGGIKCDVAVLFIDLIGSTRLAITHEPDDLVTLLNEFFAVVVDVVEEHSGLINKFEGDAVLAVFGAPVDNPCSATDALAAARKLTTRFNSTTADPAVGIGVSAGTVVAGNVGKPHRYEYTVIGDPVNEAARLSEVAKSRGGVLASAAALRRADAQEARLWRVVDSQMLRGRGESTDIAIPCQVEI